LTACRLACLLWACAALGALLGCRQDMHDQHKVKPLSRSPFFADGRGSRQPVEGTVARGQLHEDRHLHDGRCHDGGHPHTPEGEGEGEPCDTFPMPVTREVLLRGRERFDIYCSPCHSRTGDGDGMVVQRGFQKPPTFHRDELRQAKPGYLFEVVTKGLGVMPAHATQIPVSDRWAIVAYIRALQLSRAATLDDVPEPHRSELLASRASAKKGGSP
jgi:hypothetical protein